MMKPHTAELQLKIGVLIKGPNHTIAGKLVTHITVLGSEGK